MQQGKKNRMHFMWFYIAKGWITERVIELWPWRYKYHMRQLRKFMK